MISAAREVAKLSKKFFKGVGEKRERERGRQRIKKQFVILLMGVAHINTTEVRNEVNTVTIDANHWERPKILHVIKDIDVIGATFRSVKNAIFVLFHFGTVTC